MAGNGMKGMNIERGRAVENQIQVRSDMLTDEKARISAAKAALQASWHGADSQRAIDALEQIEQAYDQLIARVDEKKAELAADIAEQEATSQQ